MIIPDPSPPFELGVSQSLQERARRMIEKAGALGVARDTEVAIAEILHRLVIRPRSWGDPLMNLRHLNAVQYRGLHKDFRCIYSVHERIPIVFMTELTPLEGNPLFGHNFDV